MLRTTAMVLLGTLALVGGSRAVVHAEIVEVETAPAPGTDPAGLDAQTADIECAKNGGWFDAAAGVCDETSQ